MSVNPYESSDHPSGTGVNFLKWAVIALVALLFFGLLFSPLRRGGVSEAARRNSCMNQMRQIAIAIKNYELANGSLPPAYTVDEQGRRLHSWRTLILPYMEEITLYESIDLTKPWDDPVNAEARNTRAYFYECSSSDADLTQYVAVVGDGFAFSGSDRNDSEEFADGEGQTILFVEAGAKHAVHWMSPEDVDAKTFLQLDEATDMNHPSVILVAFADGHASWVPSGVSIRTLRAMLTTNGGEEINEE
ncbi:MAG: DUF1559 domain-containing protein [Planctomycetales bacterium]|nr:DUF1559 domain-containing protein [Planctomycetales bacterium]